MRPSTILFYLARRLLRRKFRDPGEHRDFISSAAVDPNPRVQAYVRNQRLGYEMPCQLGATPKIYRRDFIVRVEDGHGDADLLTSSSRSRAWRRTW
jgi:hypothetical protein